MGKFLRRKVFHKSNNRWKRGKGSERVHYLKALGILFLILGVAFILIYFSLWVIVSPHFKIEEVKVYGCREVTEKEILDRAQIKSNASLFSINLRAMARRIAGDPWVKFIIIKKDFPHRLVIEIKERKPVAICRVKNDLYFLDEEGVMFKKVTSDDEINVPIITGLENSTSVSEKITQAIALIKHLEKDGEYLPLNSVSEINIDSKSGFSLITEMGYQLILGFDNLEKKITRLPVVLAAVKMKNSIEPIGLIDLRDMEKTYVAKRNTGKYQEVKIRKDALRT